MVVEIVAGLITSAMTATAAVVWRYRVRMLAQPRRVRVSFSALLRIRDDDRYVLFHAINRPGSYGPPGGAYKYLSDGEAQLERLGFKDEPKPTGLIDHMRHDLRGFVDSRSVKKFIRWFDSGTGRESATECLRRELAEELAEVGHPELIDHVASLEFTPLRVVQTGPRQEPGTDYLHLRRFEVYDIAVAPTGAAAQFKQRLLELAEDPTTHLIVGVGATDIEYGRCTAGLIGGQAAFLIGTKRRHPPIPAVR
ncbi:SMODS-associated NUDIX domain-containing protein [Kibdelosporangium persicum]|uniref:SMODS-associated NUDIX domain-containing protein n=1 Tax=Kibdelosporangium persicum TaxID=2698649 RepID=UPI0015640223|nr:hypothetical protein [Kibdelosporangium persicum]